MEHIDDRNQNEALDPIVPADFTPNRGRGKSLRIRFGWGHLFLLVFLALSGTAVWYILTAKSVFIEVDPITAEVEIEGGLAIQMGQRYLIREGVYDLHLTNAGYHDLDTNLFVTDEQSQTIPVEMRKLPGLVTIEALNLTGARVQIDGVDIGQTPLNDAEIDAGEHQLTVSADRYLPHSETITVSGRSLQERFEVDLDPAWAVVSLTSQPSGADVLVDGALVGTTPLNTELLQGERDIMVRLSGHKGWQDELTVVAGRDQALPGIRLEPADGLVFISSDPSDASVTIDGEFKGQTPLEVAVAPGQEHQLTLFKAGFNSTSRSFTTAPDEEATLRVDLQPIMTSVHVAAVPEDAEIYVNGELRGRVNQTIDLLAASQQIEIRRQGYVPYSEQFTSRPGLDQAIRVTLKTLEQQRREEIQPVITTVAGQTLKLFEPVGTFQMGASRREPGRRPNETIREVRLTKPFYFSLHEVTNRQFRQFRPSHNSGTYEGHALGIDSQPVVMVTWQEAARYCNWLSEQEGLGLFYNIEEGEVTGINPQATGYRMPTEAEWAWIARTTDAPGSLRYAWGDQLPPAGMPGNIADSSVSSMLGQVQYQYTDSYQVTAPVGQFEPNFHGIYDITGNVSEWVNDYYGSVGLLGGGPEVDPMGPEGAEYHTIRGSSWADGAVTELRLSYRDFGVEPRETVGFRIARFLGEI